MKGPKGKTDFQIPLEFGRHQGKLIPEIIAKDPDYVLWLGTGRGLTASMRSQADWKGLRHEVDMAWYEFELWH